MLKLYDRESNIRFPLAERTPGEMRSMPCYATLFSGVAVIDENEDGVVTSFGSLASMKRAYGVIESDPRKALEEVEKKRAAQVAAAEAAEERERFAMQDVQQAVAELGAMTATGMESAAELGAMEATSMQSVAELGATVAALHERIAALEAAKA